ncbi:MAG: WYL domain-containing protein [Alistipes sp.]|nr:WYL domain-containing protein [Alistipes sp.]
MDQAKIERVLRLMKLMTGTTNYTIEELAELLDISSRSVYRYIDTFKAVGFVVHKSGDTVRLGKESRYFKDISQLIHFTDEEAHIVNQLIGALDDTNMLKTNLRRKLSSVYNCTSLANSVVKGRGAENVNRLVEAIESGCQVILHDYLSAHTGCRDRLVEAYAFTTNYVQVWCYDVEDGQVKLFKTSRIGSVEVTDTPWCFKEHHAQGYIDIFRHHGFERKHIELKLGMLSHNLLIEEYPLAERDLRQVGESSWILDTEVCNYAGVARFVLGLADDIEVLGSEEFLDYLRGRASEIKF